MKISTIVLFWLVLILLSQPVQSENNHGFTFKLVHPNNADLIKNDYDPNDLKIWNLFSIRYRDQVEKFWIHAQPLAIFDQENIKEAKYEISKPLPSDQTILIHLDVGGSEILERITSLHQEERIAIFWKGELLIAPVVMEKVTGGIFVITGDDPFKTRRIFDEIQLMLKLPRFPKFSFSSSSQI